MASRLSGPVAGIQWCRCSDFGVDGRNTEATSTRLAVSPDGRMAVSVTKPKLGAPQSCLWELPSLNWLGELKRHGKAIYNCAWSPCGRFVASGGGLIDNCGTWLGDQAVRIWDARRHQVVKLGADFYQVNGPARQMGLFWPYDSPTDTHGSSRAAYLKKRVVPFPVARRFTCGIPPIVENSGGSRRGASWRDAPLALTRRRSQRTQSRPALEAWLTTGCFAGRIWSRPPTATTSPRRLLRICGACRR